MAALKKNETCHVIGDAIDAADLRVWAEIDPGVPWTMALDASGNPLILMALKSGNFGGDNFFIKADAVIEATS
jgi:uncharacterized protein YgbK (DUF1537 family)